MSKTYQVVTFACIDAIHLWAELAKAARIFPLDEAARVKVL